MHMRSRVLFVSGRHGDARRLSQMLDGLPLQIDYAGSLQVARAKLREDEFDVILTEACLLYTSGPDVGCGGPAGRGVQPVYAGEALEPSAIGFLGA